MPSSNPSWSVSGTTELRPNATSVESSTPSWSPSIRARIPAAAWKPALKVKRLVWGVDWAATAGVPQPTALSVAVSAKEYPAPALIARAGGIRGGAGTCFKAVSPQARMTPSRDRARVW